MKNKTIHPFFKGLFTISAVLLSFNRPAFALNFELNGLNGFSATSNPDAWYSFERAAASWSSLFKDDMTVRLDIGFESLGSNILGSTRNTSHVMAYSDIHNALQSDSTTFIDSMATANLVSGSSLTFLTNDVSGNVIIDNNNSANNALLYVPQANLKALDLIADDGSADAEIVFSSDFSFDFDSSNGISSNQIDFEGVITHEIGHALGFTSGVDDIDLYSGNGPYAGLVSNFDPYAIFSVLDLYRYSSDSLAVGVDFDFAAGSDAYFSIDGGLTNLGYFSTGAYNGDGHQASHWKDNLGLGILDPTLAYGELASINFLDAIALDAIGYDLNIIETPVPSSIWLFLSAGLTFLAFGPRMQSTSA